MWDYPKGTEPLFRELEKLKVAHWFKDGAEQANLLNQEEADAAMSYSSDALTFLNENPDEYTAQRAGRGNFGVDRLVLQGPRHQARRARRSVPEPSAREGNPGPVPVEVADLRRAQGCDGAAALERRTIPSRMRTIRRCSSF